MKRLTKLEKEEIIKELRSEGWVGSLEEKSLLRLAQKILERQLNEIY